MVGDGYEVGKLVSPVAGFGRVLGGGFPGCERGPLDGGD